jgi:Flp pilus assembly protein TadG
MRRFLKRLLKLGRRQEGVAAVEFAIILPVLVLLILGGMDLGDMYFIQHVITNASREGARYAAKYTGTSTLPTSGQISNYVTSNLNYQSLNLNNLNVSASYTGSSPDEIVTVTVKANKYWWVLGSLGLPDPKTLTAQTAMTVEGP